MGFDHVGDIGLLFIGYAHLDIVGIGKQKAFNDAINSNWRVYLDSAFLARCPNRVKQRAKFQIVVGMMMGDNNRLNVVQLVARFHKLPGYAHACVDEVGSTG